MVISRKGWFQCTRTGDSLGSALTIELRSRLKHPKASLKTRRGVEKQRTSACLKQEEGELERHQRHWVHEKERKRQSGAREEHSVKRSEMLFKQLSWCFTEPSFWWAAHWGWQWEMPTDQTKPHQIRSDKTCPSELKPACWLDKTRDVKTRQTLF